MTGGLDQTLVALATMSPAQLRAEWRRIHRSAPPGLSVDLLRRGIAYRLQEQQHGGVPLAVRRALAAVEAGDAASVPRASVSLRAGTRLVRSWRGRSYAVLVGDHDYEFEDRRYASLTEIARTITGAAWSGPRFFGLTGRG